MMKSDPKHELNKRRQHGKIASDRNYYPGRSEVQMKKSFNVNGICYPDENYMVNLDARLKEIKQLVDGGKYFVINRARQYGKTTTLWALCQYLQKEYIVISLGFQRMSSADFRNEYAFTSAFVDTFVKVVQNKRKNVIGLDPKIIAEMKDAAKNAQNTLGLRQMFEYLSDLCACAAKPVVLMIDEVDSVSNNQVFLDFLGQLRDRYLDRRDTPIFHSVILAGVYDIKNLKQKIRQEEEHRYNSPWNIAADFRVEMSFSPEDIGGMLHEYEKDHHTGMDIAATAGLIYDYTSGYPYLVSRICKLIDEQIMGKEKFQDLTLAWGQDGITEAVKEIMKESNMLFDDMRKKLTDFPELKDMLYAILFTGKSFPYNPDNYAIDIGVMFGFLKENQGVIMISNRIFEMRLYNLFMSEEVLGSITYQAASMDRTQFVRDGILDMDRVMQKFMEHFTSVYGESDTTFVEENGRRLFLLYLKPIINGTGNYYVEARTRDMRRTDVVIDYCGRQYVVEMKIWHGEEYNRRGEQQLLGYLDEYHLTKGYMLSFNFNKNKIPGIREMEFEGKKLLEVVV